MIRGDCVYHRYIPNPDGTYRREVVGAITPQSAAPPQPTAPPHGPPPKGEVRRNHALTRLLPTGLETGDLLVLLILLLLLIDGDEDDSLTVFLTLAAFILL